MTPRNDDVGDVLIACTLNEAGYVERVQDWQDVRKRALERMEPQPDGALLLYRHEPGVEESLRALVAKEAECCPFLSFSFAERDGLLVLGVRGPEGDGAAIARAFGRQP